MLRELAHFLYHAPATTALALREDGVTVYDTIMDRLDARGAGAIRHRMAGALSGSVLEVGSGTGHMFRHYDAAARVYAIEPLRRFRTHSRERAAMAAARIELVAANAGALPFGNGTFDAIVCAFVLCSVEDIDGVLAELRRVLRPGGVLWAAEHVRSEKAVAGLLMDLLDPLWLAVNRQGCHLNRRTEEAIRAAGFVVETVERYQIFSPGLPAFPGKLLCAR